MTRERKTTKRINAVVLAGRIEQIIFDPVIQRFNYGVIQYGSNPNKPEEAMLYFPPSLYIQKDMVGHHMMLKGEIRQEKLGDMQINVTSIVPITARRRAYKEPPEWWEGPLEIDGYCAVTTFVEEKNIAKVRASIDGPLRDSSIIVT